MGIISHAIKRTTLALAHLAMTAFGYFSARTSCKELWRFVPPDAALSFDLESGVDVNDESDTMEIDDTTQTNKKIKFPDGIGERVSLLQSVLRIIASRLSLWQQNQLDYSDIHATYNDLRYMGFTYSSAVSKNYKKGTAIHLPVSLIASYVSCFGK
nr:hypothetical protein [Tanacetum cinerariifolium]